MNRKQQQVTSMLTVNKLLTQGRGLAPALLKRAAHVELDWDVRQKSRFEATDSMGRSLGVFLPRGTVVRGADVLVAEDGSLIRVQAAPQPVLVVRHCPEHGKQSDLIRAAYHLGNRHVAVALSADHLMLEADHVLAAMLRGMHLIVSEGHAGFEPEGGAYHGRHASQPGEAPQARDAGPVHDHGHSHDHGAGQARGHEPDPACKHVHEHGHGHGHGH